MKNTLLLAVFFLMLSCANNPIDSDLLSSSSATDAAIYPVTMSQFLIGKGTDTGLLYQLPAQKILINNQNSWNLFLNQLIVSGYSSSSLTPTFTTTNIDFNNFMVLVCVDILKPTDTFNINIVNVIENQNNINVTVTNTGSIGFLLTVGQPYHIVRIPKRDKPVVFD